MTLRPTLDTQVLAIAERFMQAFDIPGVTLSIVLPDHPGFAVAAGLRALGENTPVDIDTSFAVASNSKAYLTACLAMLVDEGSLSWDDPVVQHLPEFRMQDPVVTSMMTVRDLLVHRSGLPLGAGDLMQFPRTDHTRDEVLRALQYFKPAKGFRAGYAYDNCLYIVAGLLLERVSGLSWDAFVEHRIFKPLGMSDAVSNPTLVSTANRAARHARLGPPTIGMGALERIEPDEPPIIGPAGGINVSARSTIAWLNVQLGRGQLPDGRRLWSESAAAEMWTPQTIISGGPGPTPEMPQRSVLQAYALGWGVSDYRGSRMITHGGGLAGQATRTTLLPERGIGLAVFTNAGDAEPVSSLRYALLDHLLGVPEFDWIGSTRKAIDETHKQVVTLLGDGDFKAPAGTPSLPLECYAGRYRDRWYGDVVIAYEGGRLSIDFTRTRVFKSGLEPFGADRFRTRFARGAGEDAVLSFALVDGAVTGIAMQALSPIADFSFDFKDLAFVRVSDE
jgi:CubicO group peptidase (beta-lactamase class C family)